MAAETGSPRNLRVILNPHADATRADMIALACTAHFALASGIEERPAGYVMAVTMGNDPADTFGVIRRKGSVSVYPPDPKRIPMVGALADPS